MDKPAVIMNEAAFKLLLQALTGREIGTADPVEVDPIDEPENDEVSAFLKGWHESGAAAAMEAGEQPRQGEKREYKTRNKALVDKEYQTVKEIMQNNGPMKLTDIHAEMKKRGFWDVPGKQATQKMGRILKKHPDIKRVDRGIYEIETDQDIFDFAEIGGRDL
jgi:hypothetical protein